jgi:hypothetical protein
MLGDDLLPGLPYGLPEVVLELVDRLEPLGGFPDSGDQLGGLLLALLLVHELPLRAQKEREFEDGVGAGDPSLRVLPGIHVLPELLFVHKLHCTILD